MNRPVKLEKHESSSSNNIYEEMLLSSTKLEILKENHETLQRDHKSLKESFKYLEEMKDAMKFHFENQTKELEDKNQRLLEELERERSENEKFKKKIEEMERTENVLVIKNQKLLIEMKKEDKELKNIGIKYRKLTERLVEIEKECCELDLLFEEDHDLNKTMKERIRVADKVIVVKDQKANNTVKDPILIIDDDTNAMGSSNVTVPQCPKASHEATTSKAEIKRTSGNDQSEDFKTKKIFVGGLPKTITEDELKEFFAKYGTVVEQEIIRDHETNKSRGFGFVIFDSESVVDELLSKGKLIEMANTQVSIKKAKPKKSSNLSPLLPTSPGWGYGYGYGYGYGGRGVGGYQNEPAIGYPSPFGSYRGGRGGGYGPYGRYHPYGR